MMPHEREWQRSYGPNVIATDGQVPVSDKANQRAESIPSHHSVVIPVPTNFAVVIQNVLKKEFAIYSIFFAEAFDLLCLPWFFENDWNNDSTEQRLVAMLSGR